MATNITIKPAEKSTAKVNVSGFTDESGNSITPLTFTWKLTDKSGNVINSRSAVSVTPASTIAFVLSGDDLALTGSLERVLTLQWTYNSTLGSNLPGKEQVFFEIESLVGVT